MTPKKIPGFCQELEQEQFSKIYNFILIKKKLEGMIRMHVIYPCLYQSEDEGGRCVQHPGRYRQSFYTQTKTLNIVYN